MILEAAQKGIYPGLFEKIKNYRILEDKNMPVVYQKGGGRDLHEDWFIGKKTPRILTAYRPPMPFKMFKGNAVLIENPLPLDYPLTPDAKFSIRPWFDGKNNVDKKWVWMVDPIQPAGHWAELMVYLPDGTWERCYKTQSINFLGNKLVSYMGFRPDPHPVDAAAWFPELCPLSIKWGTTK